MNFADIFKQSFLQGYASSSLTMTSVVSCMVVVTLVSGYIFMVYRLISRDSFYNLNFNIALPAIAVITAAIILTIQASIVISLGMVGALSIVRFRTAVKDPMDLVFLFWAISAGIICGAGLSMIAVIASVVVTVIVVAANRLPRMHASQILLVSCDTCENERAVMEEIENSCSLYKVKSRNMASDRLDMAVEVRIKDAEGFMLRLVKLPHVTNASLVDHDGEVTF